jgi:hypothetical protein
VVDPQCLPWPPADELIEWVECPGDVATVLDALRAAGQEGAVLAVQRA